MSAFGEDTLIERSNIMPKSSDQISCQEVFRGFAEEYAGFSARNLLLNAWNRGCYPCQKSGTRGKDALKRMIGSARIFQAFRLVCSANVCRANVSGFLRFPSHFLKPRTNPWGFASIWLPASVEAGSSGLDAHGGHRRYYTRSRFVPGLMSVVAVCLHAFPIGAGLQDAQPAGHRLRPKPAALLKGMTLSWILTTVGS